MQYVHSEDLPFCLGAPVEAEGGVCAAVGLVDPAGEVAVAGVCAAAGTSAVAVEALGAAAAPKGRGGHPKGNKIQCYTSFTFTLSQLEMQKKNPVFSFVKNLFFEKGGNQYIYT